MDKTQRRVVVIGLLGTTLDMGKHPDRWQNWRLHVDAAPGGFWELFFVFSPSVK
jgi:hypothetical protein